MTRFKLSGCGIVLAAALAAQGSGLAQAAAKPSVARLALPAPVSGPATSRAPDPNSTVQVVVRLTDKPLVVAVGPNAKRAGSKMTIDQRIAYVASLKSKQDAVAAKVRALGGVETSRVSKTLNAVVFNAKVSTLPQIMKIPGVVSVRPMATYTLHLGETVPYIGAAALQTSGLTGAGIKVAVLDSGIDYTHKNLGGSGNVADYATSVNNPTVIPVGLFPTAKVIGGYDFVGDAWPDGPRTQDPNPSDVEGHGTHVADIVGGKSLDGTHKGVAPGAQLYAVKVCSDVSSRCNGEAILLGLDWVVDPNGDLDFSDAADVINFSIGAGYGQREDDSTLAMSNLARFGMVISVSAGNSADRPYITGQPSTTPEVISVAQTQVPSASTFAVKVNSPAPIAGVYGNTATVDWAPVGAGFSGDVKTALQGGAANNLACAALPAGSLTGKVALIDRGSCSISVKVDFAARAGAIGMLLALNAPGDAVSFSFGGPDPFMPVPLVVIQQSLGNAIKANLTAPVNVSVNNSSKIDLIGSMAGTSSRGPSYSYNQIKPEIGAPGASLSAVVGTGTGQEAFGGTSGAAPMVAGSAALLLQKFPAATSSEIKSRLMNTANSTIYTNPATLPGVLAPITRIGSGEVRVDKAAAITTGVWDATNPYNVGLSFGTLRATGITTLSKKVAVRNYAASARVYNITRSFRYADDAASGAVTLTAPASINVPANGTASFTLTMKVDASKLPLWNLAFPGNQGNGALLNAVEFDGYISLNDAAGSVSVPWHVLPHKAAGVEVAASSVAVGDPLIIGNPAGAADGYVDAFALTGTSPQISTVLPPPGSNEVLIDLKAVGVREYLGDDIIQFAITTYGQRSHPSYPAEFDVYIDTNADGVDDYVIYTGESGTFASTGQTLVYVSKLGSGTATAFYFADSDLSSSNMVMTLPASAIGVVGPTKIKFSVYVFDNYFTGNLRDSVVGMTYTLGQPRYTLALDSFSLPVGVGGGLPVTAVPGGAAASPSQTGFLLIYADGKSGRESDVVTVTPAAP
jgi:subtilisin family serine protease